MKVSLSWFTPLLPLALLVSACPGELEDPERFTAVCDVENGLFVQQCGSSSCHDDSSPAGGLDLISPGVDTRLIGVEAACSKGTAESECDCSEGSLRLLVDADPDTVDSSYLMEKLTSSTPACDDAMPLLSELLPQRDIDCLRSWLIEKTGGQP